MSDAAPPPPPAETDRKALKQDAAAAKARSKAARPWFKKKRFILPLALLLLIVLVVATSGGDDAPDTADADTDTDTDAGAADAAEGDDADLAAEDLEDGEAPEESEVDGLGVGDSIAMGDLEHVLHGARFAEGDEFMSPDEGERWLVLDVELTNSGDSSEAVSSIAMWTLLNEENRSQDFSIGALMDADGQLDGELGAGRSLRGELGYDVSTDGPWELIFGPSLFGFGQAIYTIDLADIE
jgi:hypothetical protein